MSRYFSLLLLRDFKCQAISLWNYTKQGFLCLCKYEKLGNVFREATKYLKFMIKTMY